MRCVIIEISEGEDNTVKLINFETSATLDDHTSHGIPRCTHEDLDAEFRKVVSILSDDADQSHTRRHFIVPTRRYSTSWVDEGLPHMSGAPVAEDAMSTDPVLTGPSTTEANTSAMTQVFLPSCAIPPSTSYMQQSTSSRSAISTETIDMDVVEYTASFANTPPYVAQTLPTNTTHRPSPRIRERRAKRVAFHPDTEDNWIWASGLGAQKSKQPSEAESTDEDVPTKGSHPDLLRTATTQKTHNRHGNEANGSETQKLTYYEPPPHRGESSLERAEQDSVIKIVITSPTGEDQIWETTPAFAMELSRLLDLNRLSPNDAAAAGSTLETQFPAGAASVSRKRKAEDDEREQFSKRKSSSRGPADVGPNGGTESSRPKESSWLKRKAEETADEQHRTVRQKKV